AILLGKRFAETVTPPYPIKCEDNKTLTPSLSQFKIPPRFQLNACIRQHIPQTRTIPFPVSFRKGPFFKSHHFLTHTISLQSESTYKKVGMTTIPKYCSDKNYVGHITASYDGVKKSIHNGL
ncbi:3903_t:CDS:2, partial [Funneliformis mosseae]